MYPSSILARRHIGSDKGRMPDLLSVSVPEDGKHGQTSRIQDEHSALHRAQGQAGPISAVAGSSQGFTNFQLALPQRQGLLLCAPYLTAQIHSVRCCCRMTVCLIQSLPHAGFELFRPPGYCLSRSGSRRFACIGTDTYFQQQPGTCFQWRSLLSQLTVTAPE